MTSDKVATNNQDCSAEHHQHPHKIGLWGLIIGAIGVVYGDIGTSPLYAFREAILAATEHKAGQIVPETGVVMGLLSLIIWALVMIVSLKYVALLLRADNKGEGGTLSLMALALRSLGGRNRFILALGMLGAALFYGDSIITPAISVLSAVEGLKLISPQSGHYVVPITVLILIGLFAVQSRGTEVVARFFGPITVVWFLAMASTGLINIIDQPQVLLAISPHYGIQFLFEHGKVGLLVLGTVFLAVTGAEALYADLGHFGRKPIQIAWIFIVFPCLLLNYFGQAALILTNPQALENPFYLMAPDWALVPIVILATFATVIASQAVITGAFSLSRQAIQLGLLPRMDIRFTSADNAGQIYLPQINKMLLIGVLCLVLAFRTSGNLAEAYGVAVSGDMVIGTMMAFVVFRYAWKWPLWRVLMVVIPFGLLEWAFLAANAMKLLHGGWVPLAMSSALVIIMVTWRRGSQIVYDKGKMVDFPLVDLIGQLTRRPPHKVAGTAIYLSADPIGAPSSLMHSLKHFRVLHEKVVVLKIATIDVPRVYEKDRFEFEMMAPGFYRMTINFGFMESPEVENALMRFRHPEWQYERMNSSFFLSRKTIKADAGSDMPGWQDALFIMLYKNSDDAVDYFNIPSDRVVEIGSQMTV
jgi:KUP system potassium uptake protein